MFSLTVKEIKFLIKIKVFNVGIHLKTLRFVLKLIKIRLAQTSLKIYLMDLGFYIFLLTLYEQNRFSTEWLLGTLNKSNFCLYLVNKTLKSCHWGCHLVLNELSF